VSTTVADIPVVASAVASCCDTVFRNACALANVVKEPTGVKELLTR
jgi:hypothetical protein